MKNLCVFLLSLFACSVSLAAPPIDVGKGGVQIGVYATAGEKSDLNGLVVDNDGTVRGDVFYGLSDKFTIGLRHKDIDVQRELSRNILGRRFSTAVDGNLKESDLLFLFRLTNPKKKKRPQVHVYTGVKRLEGELYPKNLTGSITIGNRTYTGTARIEGKHKVVTGATVGFMSVFPVAKNFDIWADAHYCHYINGFEVGTNYRFLPNVGLDLSYFYDRYRYKEYNFTDKGFRAGLTFALKK